MITITLPDGNTLEFTPKITGLEVAQSIAKSLAKAAIAVDLDNQLHDLSFAIEKNCHFPEFHEIVSGSEVLTDCLGQANNSSHPHIHAVKVTNYKCQISKIVSLANNH